MTSASLDIEGLELWYGDFRALSGIDLALEQGAFLALLGPSGCGKTSLLRSIAGFVHPQRGIIRIGGKDIVKLPPRERNLGMVFQHFALFPHMTAAQNVAFGLKCRKVGRAEAEQRVNRTLDMVGLGQFAARLPRQLSGGQQQRVALARALVIEPDVLLLDEPLGALDKKLRVQMQTELQTLQRRLNITSVFVTHDQEEAMAMADRIAIMREGEIEQLGDPQSIFTAPETTWAADFVGSGNVLRGHLKPNGNGLLRIDLPAGCDFHVRPRAASTADQQAALFVRAEQVRLEPTGSNTELEVVSQRFLGVHVEVQAAYKNGVIKALVPPALAGDLNIGTRVRATADPDDCRLIPEGTEPPPATTSKTEPI
jgi:ABC-type Fe3+/spermidine/putrescine transport system ATPase subunit